MTWLSVRRDDGLLSREWDLGCFNDDIPADHPRRRIRLGHVDGSEFD
ncbi:hypothetical protein GCM10010156_42990 [Planobispora rosea]|uniref:Uncharacterized protein n=1 Tax=Planobispora rosea TaxID=35762 RepID=A0A8J3WFE9_PLARO|nr:hypothetical protein [Planobispora rosea]GGS79648.1 hypothetical protein GCM10010156_42990 [Planobispora rosea]GIH85846.1 hypothetical protein Pro02_42540 [Planobispora rosea]